MTDAPKKSGGGLSLYAHLLGDSNAGTISSAPITYEQQAADQDAAAAQKKKDASLQFQPIKRPQVKARPKPAGSAASSSAHKLSSSTATASSLPPGLSSTPSVQRSNFEDWVGDEDEGYYYQDRKQNQKRNQRKKKKQQRQEQEPEAPTWDWDDIYDPTRPNSYGDYKGSDEQYREHRDWKARLYYYQLKDAKRAKKQEEQKKPIQSMFAPPTSLSFAPPIFDDKPPIQPMDLGDDEYHPTDRLVSEEAPRAPPSFAPPTFSDDATGDDAYQQRLRMGGMPPAVNSPPVQSSPPKQVSPPAQPTPPPIEQLPDAEKAAKIAEAHAKIAALKAKMIKPPTPGQPEGAAPNRADPPALGAEHPPLPPPVEQSGTISRAPVKYEVKDEPLAGGIKAEELDDVPRSKKPGQKGFAERLMSKYGWEKGQGLGASGDGITTALIGKADKKSKKAAQGQKRSDPDGGRAPPVTMGKIVGGKRRKIEGAEEEQKMSDVIKLEGMLDGLDVAEEIEDNNLLQEVGEEFGGKYGTVERVFVWRAEQGGSGEVFVKFTSPLSALNAVNAYAREGVEFAGNTVVARFWDSEKFEKGEYGG